MPRAKSDSPRPNTAAELPVGHRSDDLPPITITDPPDGWTLVEAWRRAWAYADEHGNGRRGAAWSAFLAISEHADGYPMLRFRETGYMSEPPDSLHEQDIMHRLRGNEPDYHRREGL